MHLLVLKLYTQIKPIIFCHVPTEMQWSLKQGLKVSKKFGYGKENCANYNKTATERNFCVSKSHSARYCVARVIETQR